MTARSKKWLTGVLVALSIAGSYAAAKLSGNEGHGLIGMPCAAAHIVFEQKKRCGFLDLGQLVTVEGRVGRVKGHTDGDQSIKVILDPEFERFLSYKGRRTSSMLKAEFMPCERSYTDVEAVLQQVSARYRQGIPTRVRITGRFAYDGVDHRGKWRDQLGNCLGGRDADPAVGWTEIHPAYTVTIIDD